MLALIAYAVATALWAVRIYTRQHRERRVTSGGHCPANPDLVTTPIGYGPQARGYSNALGAPAPALLCAFAFAFPAGMHRIAQLDQVDRVGPKKRSSDIFEQSDVYLVRQDVTLVNELEEGFEEFSGFRFLNVANQQFAVDLPAG
jgi:hypothetical protein